MLTNKISLEALKLAGFKNPTAIAQIISYVPNPNVALEMLLGIHEPIVIDQLNRFKKHKNDSCSHLVEIITYDELADKVMYKKYTQKTQQIWFVTAEDYKNQTNGLAVRPDRYHDYRNIPAEGFNESEDYDTIESFKSNYSKDIHNYEAFETLNNWENWGMVTEEVPVNEDAVL